MSTNEAILRTAMQALTHPAILLRTAEARREAWVDLLALPNRLPG